MHPDQGKHETTQKNLLSDQEKSATDQEESATDLKEPLTDQEDPLGKQGTQKRTLKSLVNTPLKKAMFGIQVLSYMLIVGSPLIGGAIGRFLDLKTGQTAGVILGVFIAGEILFYGSLAFLGRELLLLLRERVKGWFGFRKRG